MGRVRGDGRGRFARETGTGVTLGPRREESYFPIKTPTGAVAATTDFRCQKKIISAPKTKKTATPTTVPRLISVVHRRHATSGLRLFRSKPIG